MAYQSRASAVRHRHHFSALWSFILHRRVVSLLLFSVSRSERACHPERRRREGPAFLSHLADGGNSRSFARARSAPSDNLGCSPGVSRSFTRARAARSLRMTTPRGLRGGRKGEEGPALGAPQARRTCFFARFRGSWPRARPTPPFPAWSARPGA